MSQTYIITPQDNFGKVAVASVPATYDALTITAKPTSGIVYDAQLASGASSPSLVRLVPYASATGLTSVGMRLVAWNSYPTADGSATRWIPTVLGDFTLTFSSGTVPTWTLDSSNDARPFAGITQVAGTPTANLFSPGTAAATNVEPAAALIDAMGAQVLQVQFKSSGTPTMGVLWATI
jgi:hypothetical protein